MVEIKPQVCNEIPQELTPGFKTSYCYIAELIKILSNLIAFLGFKTWKKLSNSFQYKLEGDLYSAGGELITECIFLFTGRWVYE